MAAKALIGSGTDPGQVREENQDATSFFRTSDDAWTLLIVCDGMGGHAGGKQASAMAAESIGREFTNRVGHTSPAEALAESVKAANRTIVEFAEINTEFRGMGTTCIVLAVTGNDAYVAHVGDSRVYRVRPGSVEQLTTDHSYVQRMIDSGILTPEQAEAHPDANMLMRCLGGKSDVEVDVIGPEKVRAGDRYVLCSDGLWGQVTAPEIAAMASAFPAQDAVNRLIRLANERGGPDNISVQIYHQSEAHSPTGVFSPEKFAIKKFAEKSEATGRPSTKPSLFTRIPRLKIWILGIVAAVLVVSGGMALSLYKKNTGTPQAVKKTPASETGTASQQHPVVDNATRTSADDVSEKENKRTEAPAVKNQPAPETEKDSENVAPPAKPPKSSKVTAKDNK